MGSRDRIGGNNRGRISNGSRGRIRGSRGR